MIGVMSLPPADRDTALGDTIQNTPSTQPDDTRPIDATPLRSVTVAERYVPTESLGKGGMGIVMSVRDEQIGREIAIKRLLASRRDNESVRARFEREARVQAQLEHPSIVPVYDLGVDAQGDAWFTMKKVKGVTLAHGIARLRAGDAAISLKYSRRRLLTAFTNVCLAIDFAHARGIVHRDLKPENVMLGDFGEVYVLDWGIAKIAGVSDAELSRPSQAALGGEAGGTEAGEVLGTIGYMPPEQLASAATVQARSDVWALGAILFEILALEPLLPRMTLGEAIASIGDPIDRSPSRRARDASISPRLDEICERATAPEIGDRYRSARALHDDVMAFLDGDLEAQRRREQAQAHLERAREAEARAADAAQTAQQRTVAMQEINKALALDPTNEPAKHAMVRMLLQPAPSLPKSARAELEQARVDETRVGFRVGALGFLSMYLFLPLYLWMGIRDWAHTGAVLALIGVSAGLLWWGSRVPSRARVAMQLTVVSAGVLIALLARVVGTFASAPLLTFLMAVGLVFNRTQLGWKSVLALVMISLGAPMLLELAGVIAPSYAFSDGHIEVLPHMTDLPPVPTMVTMTLTCVSCIGLAAFFLMRVHALLRRTQEQLWGYSWNLRQFLPELPGAPQAGSLPGL